MALRNRLYRFSLVAVCCLTFAMVAVIAARAQNASAAHNNVPPTARQAAQMPQYASRLHPSARPLRGTPVPRAQRSPRDPMWPQDSVIYENGPVNGTTDAWTINFGYTVSDSFTAGRFKGFDFYTWSIPGDTLQTVDWSISSDPNGGTVYGSGTASVTQTFISSNQYGYDINKETVTGLSVPLDSGTVWLNLQNAATAQDNLVYWDENSGIGCKSSGCPSQAVEIGVGTIPSEAFDVTGSSTTKIDCGASGPWAFHLTDIYPFTGQEDGSSPTGVTVDQSGTLYGTTSAGGTNGAGTAFKLTQNGLQWTITNLYSFTGGADGWNPSAVIVGPDGALYGTAEGGEPNCNGQECGFVFRARPFPFACRTALCSWTVDVLYMFKGGTDVWGPGLLAGFDQEGDLYGFGGGGSYGAGAVFKLTRSGDKWSETVIYSFTGASDSRAPYALVVGKDGDLYGTSFSGGPYDRGFIFQLAPANNGWTDNTLLSFSGGYNGADPSYMVEDGAGNLYVAYVEEVYNPQGNEWAAEILEASYWDGKWTFGHVAEIRPGDFESNAFILSLAMDPEGNLYGQVYAVCGGCFPYPAFIFNRIFTVQTYGFDFAAELGKDFNVAGPMATAGFRNLFFASGCGGHGGAIWRLYQ